MPFVKTFGTFFDLYMKTTYMKNSLVLILCLSFSIFSYPQSRTGMLEDLECGQGQQILQQNPTAVLKSAARLFGEKDDLTTVIAVLPKETKVTVLDSDSSYYYVQFEDAEGYILKRQAVLDDTPVTATVNDSRQETRPVEGAHPVRKDNISRFTYLENKYGTATARQLNARKIWKGMDGEMVRDSWGNPLKIDRVISSNTVKEEWTYKNTIIYLENNKLVNWGPVK